jgi:hypothetical protein
MREDCRKAFAAGLSFRPLLETVRDVADENASGAREPARPTRGVLPGLDPAKEREVLRAWTLARKSATAAPAGD